VRRIKALLIPQHARATTARLAVAILALGLLPVSPVVPYSLTAPADAAPAEVARAECGADDRPEPSANLQGQVSLAQRFAFKGTSCHLSLVGAFGGPGGSWVGASYGDCAYYPTVGDGVVVVDVSDPQHPRQTATLRSPAMLRTWESLKANPARRLLAATAVSGNAFDVYDISDCRQPRLLSSNAVPDLMGHEGEWAPDGRTYYATSRTNTTFRDFGFQPIDVSDPRAPRPMPRWDTPGWGRTHGLSLSPDGRRMYLTVPAGFGNGGSGMAVLDVSAVQERDPKERVRVVSTAAWADGHEAQMTIPLAIDGRPHVLVTDEKGSLPVERGPRACRLDRAAFGYPRLIDVADETNPRQVAAVRLQVQDPRNCGLVLRERLHPFTYSTHYCSVDRIVEPRLLACATFGAGVRVYDISDVAQLREVAYFNPPPRKGTRSEKGVHRDLGVDWVTSPPHFRLDRGELWAQFQDNGLLVLRFDDQVRALLD